MRSLSPSFVASLKNGLLSHILQRVKNDATLDLEIRNNWLNIYYRGGNLCSIKEKTAGVYEFGFNEKYTHALDSADSQRWNAVEVGLQVRVTDLATVNVWLDAFPHIKFVMDLWFGKHPKLEREFQQLMARENNSVKDFSSDYFICDIEYANKKARARFDALAVHWPSIGSERKRGSDRRLAIIEMKYGDGALKNPSGIKKHLEDANSACGDPNRLMQIKSDAQSCFNQKRDLNLIKDAKRGLESFSDEKPELIFVFAAHDPESTTLKDELNAVSELDFKHIDIKVAVSTFSGYGLFEQNIYSLADFKKSFQSQISAS